MTRLPRRARPVLAALVLALGIGACASPHVQERGRQAGAPRFADEVLVTADGVRLPVRAWLPDGPPRAAIVALHGMNDYGNAFALPGERWRRAGIATYAYDQRGFGDTAQRQVWAGVDVMTEDFRTAVRLIRERHPGIPVYGLGMSMGGAIALAAAADPEPPDIDGLILVAPAVWGRATQPTVYTAGLWLLAHTVPTRTITPQRLVRLRRTPTDNTALLREMWKDPLVLKGSRVDVTWGVVNAMDAGYAAAGRVRLPVLLLYGHNDQIIPPAPVRDVAAQLVSRGGSRVRIALYPQGYHMLLRDLNRHRVHDDVAAWIADPSAPLPSGADQGDALEWLGRPHPCWQRRGFLIPTPSSC